MWVTRCSSKSKNSFKIYQDCNIVSITLFNYPSIFYLGCKFRLVKDLEKFIYSQIHKHLSFIAVGMNSRDQYEIIGLREISHTL